MLIRKYFLCIFFLCILSNCLVAKSSPSPTKTEKVDDSKDEEPPKIGNFALPSSQQPTSLIAFGERILEKGQTQVFLFGSAFIGKHNYRTDIAPSIVYGLTDNFAIFFEVPFAPKNKDGGHTSSGIEDISLQLEYAYYSKKNRCFSEQATVLGSITFPTGSSKKNPPTGLGALGFFAGLTYNRTYVDWFYFGSIGAAFPTEHHGTRFGDQFLYQAGIGRNICGSSSWIYACMVEMDGVYSWKNKIDSQQDPNSGGNVIYITPSLWISSRKLILQFGVGYPIIQDLFGSQSKQRVSVVFNLGWTL